MTLQLLLEEYVDDNPEGGITVTNIIVEWNVSVRLSMRRTHHVG
jgi:hypothetical protein